MPNLINQYEHFQFQNPGELRDNELRVVLEECTPADPKKGWVPAYEFKICIGDSDKKIGNVNLRAGTTPALEFLGGHIGYGVDLNHRGKHLAERACRLLIPFIKNHGFSEIWITCSPENIASRRTCERLGAKFIEIVEVPADSDMFALGERRKCRYCLKL